MSYSHSHKPNLPITYSSSFSMWVMGFDGGGCNITIAIALPHQLFLYCIVNIRKFMGLLYFIFYAYLRHWFMDMETNPVLWHPVYSMMNCYFGVVFMVFVLPVLVCCSAEWCSATDTHLKL